MTKSQSYTCLLIKSRSSVCGKMFVAVVENLKNHVLVFATVELSEDLQKGESGRDSRFFSPVLK